MITLAAQFLDKDRIRKSPSSKLEANSPNEEREMQFLAVKL
jgi:hypothetical protein